MKEIILSKGTVLLDDDDYEKIQSFSWHMHGQGYAHAWVRGIKVLMHRLILNRPDGFIDHINGNKLDNRKENLRICTPKQNSANMGLSKNNKTGYKGVYWNKEKKKYDAQIKINGKSTYIGRFENPEEAAKAYDDRAKKEFGEFAHVNNN